VDDLDYREHKLRQRLQSQAEVLVQVHRQLDDDRVTHETGLLTL
jgi:hypothetical protein